MKSGCQFLCEINHSRRNKPLDSKLQLVINTRKETPQRAWKETSCIFKFVYAYVKIIINVLVPACSWEMCDSNSFLVGWYRWQYENPSSPNRKAVACVDIHARRLNMRLMIIKGLLVRDPHYITYNISWTDCTESASYFISQMARIFETSKKRGSKSWLETYHRSSRAAASESDLGGNLDAKVGEIFHYT